MIAELKLRLSDMSSTVKGLQKQADVDTKNIQDIIRERDILTKNVNSYEETCGLHDIVCYTIVMESEITNCYRLQVGMIEQKSRLSLSVSMSGKRKIWRRK